MVLGLGLSGLVLVSTPAGAANDYPWPSANPNQMSPLRFYYRNCTDFVAWKLNEARGGSVSNIKFSWSSLAFPGGDGNARGWKQGAINSGFAANGTPTVGSVAWWGTEVGGGFGHVAIVTGVNSDGSASVEEYNSGVSYGYGTRASVRADAYLHIADTNPVGEGSFVSHAGYVYRIVGGAPLYVASWNDVGGPQSATALSDQQFSALRQYPADGTFVGAGGYVFRFAGGAPLYVASWNDVGGPQSAMAVSLSTLNNGDGPVPYDHTHMRPADGTFVGAGGYVFRFAGGAPLYVASWNDVGGSQPSTAVSLSTLENGDGATPYNHTHKRPADGTYVVADGPVYVFAGGAPIYVSSWANVGGQRPVTAVSASTLANGDGAVPYNHMHAYPADGTILTALPGGATYRVFQGAAVPLASHPAGVGVDQVAIANAGGSSAFAHLKKAGAGFHALTPTRVLDSRTPTGGWNAKLNAGTPKNLTVTGAAVPATASAVVMNVTVTGGSAPSFLTVYPAGASTPNASNINFGAGETIPNLVTVKVGAAGAVAFANAAGSVDVIADVVGWYDNGLSPGDSFRVSPNRVLDSRTATGGWNAKLAAGDASTRDLLVKIGPVPAGATAVVANITVTNGSDGSFVQAWPTGTARPNSSNVNFARGQSVANLAVVPVGAGGKISLFNAVGSVDVIVDIVGYYDPADGGGRLHAAAPTRVLDDRSGVGLTGAWTANQSRALLVAGTASIPATATAVVANVTVTNASAGSFVTVYTNTGPRPTASSINFGPGDTRANLTVTSTGADGKIALYNANGSVDIIADAVGYFALS